MPDPFNDIYVDVVAAVGAGLVPPALFSQTGANKVERRQAREQFAALIGPVLALFVDRQMVP